MSRVNHIKLPTRLKEIERKSHNTIIVSLDEGWEISFRIHNTRTLLEPSLKFDIQLISSPQTLYMMNPG